MVERPVLFSAPMVRALLAGRKTQTRRIAKPRRANSLLAREPDGSMMWTDSFILDAGNRTALLEEAPAHVGETMYVREAFRFGVQFDDVKPSMVPQTQGSVGRTVFYEADGTPCHNYCAGKLRPGIHMPRWCSRIERTIVDVRLERLEDCSEADAIAEGLVWNPALEAWAALETPSWPTFTDPRRSYAGLWNHINGPGSWAQNPLVWVIEFSPS